MPTHDITTRTWYHAAGNTTAVRDPRGITTRTLYNVRDQVAMSIANCTDTGTTTPSTNPSACTGGTLPTTANVPTEFTYDGAGNQTKTIQAAGLAGYTTTTAGSRAERTSTTSSVLLLPFG